MIEYQSNENLQHFREYISCDGCLWIGLGFVLFCMCEMAMMKVYMCRNGKSIYIYIFIYSSISVRTMCPMVKKQSSKSKRVTVFSLEYLYDYTLLVELEKAIDKLFLNMIVVIICVYCTTSF